MKKNICLVVFMLLLSSITYAQQCRAYLKLGGFTAGESVVVGFTDFVEVYGVQYSFSNKYLNFHSENNTAAFPITGAISFTKFKSKSSKDFFQLVTTGSHIADLEILFVKIINGVPTVFASYKANDIAIAAISEGNDLTEKIDIQIAKIQITYIPISSNGDSGTQIKYGWDFVESIPWNPQ